MPKFIPLDISAAEYAAQLKKMREVHWYGLHVSAQHERKLVDRFVNEKGMQAYVPVRKEKHRWSDRMKIVEQVLTPSLIFVKNCMANKNAVFIENNVKSYVYAPGKNQPSPIADDKMEDFIRAVGSDYEISIATPSKGDTVMVLDGPMKGLVGEMVRTESKDKITIRLNDAFAVEVKIPSLSVRVVPEGTKSILPEDVPNKV